MCVEHKDHNDEQELVEFERKLRMAMQHREAPLGMKQRALARARERRQTQRGHFWMVQRIAASIVLAAAVGGFAAYRYNEERIAEQKRGEEAREQVMTALRITSRTLGRVNERLMENGR